MFDLDKCRKQGWKVLVHTNKGWRTAQLSVLLDTTGDYEELADMDLPDLANLPEKPEPAKETTA